MADINFRGIAGFLIDLDGVIYLEDEPYPGAGEVISLLKERGKACRFVTNTTTKSRDLLHSKIRKLNLPIELGELITPPKLAADFLKKQGRPKLHLIMDDDTMRDFGEFELTDTQPDFIVIGNYGEKWDYKLLNKLFHMMLNGAELLALHRQRFWQTGDGLKLDIGCFITGLEYSTGKKATAIGKPEPLFFQTALESMDLSPEEAVMIGDDIESDIGGAKGAGIKSVLVKTGKYRDELVAKSNVDPDLVIESIGALRDFL